MKMQKIDRDVVYVHVGSIIQKFVALTRMYKDHHM